MIAGNDLPCLWGAYLPEAGIMPTKISCQTEVSPAFQGMSDAERPKNCHDAGLQCWSGVRAGVIGGPIGAWCGGLLEVR